MKNTIFKKSILCLTLLLCSLFLNAQLQNTNWYFGKQAGLNFNDGTLSPTPLTDSQMLTGSGSATVSDTSGNLLFYTDGRTVWNANSAVMPNGTEIAQGFSTVSQSTVIIPVPGDSNKYYIFSNNASEMGLGGLYYSIVDMTLDGGLGDVDVNTKRVNLIPISTSQKMTAVFNPNDNTFWLVIFGYSSDIFTNDTFFTYKIDATGVSLAQQATFTFSYAEKYLVAQEGQMKISPDGQSLALIHNTSLDGPKGSIADAQSLFTFDFDMTTGVVSTMNHIALTDNLYAYGVEFSPDSNLLYATSITKLSDQLSSGRVFQIDYRGGMPLMPVIIYNDSDPIYSLQLGIDDKIYSVNDTEYIGTINSPNTTGTGANFLHNNILSTFGNGAKDLPQLSPHAPTVAPKPILKVYNTSYLNDTITRLKAKNSGVVVFGKIGADNVDNLPGLGTGFIADYSDTGTVISSEVQQLPYQAQLDLGEDTYKWEELANSTGLNGEVNKNYKLIKYDNNNQAVFEINTVNINEELIEDTSNGQTYLVFPTSSFEDVSVTGATGRSWTKSATQQFVQDSTVYTKTYNLARFNTSGELINVIELLNYKWARNNSGGTALVDFPTKVVGDNNTLYFTTASRDEGIYTSATKISLTNGEFHKKGEWLLSYDVNSNSFKKTKLLGQGGSVIPSELIYNESTLYRKRKNQFIKLDTDLNSVDSLATTTKLLVLECNDVEGTFLIRGDNKRTIKKVDADFNEIWSKSLGNKFEVTHASEAPNGDVYVAGSYTEDAVLKNPDNTDLTHNAGYDVFVAKVNGLPIVTEDIADKGKSTFQNQKEEASSQPQITSKNAKDQYIVTYPNPFKDALYVQLKSGDNYDIKVYDINGKLVYKNVAKAKKVANQLEVNTSNFKSGIYNVIITNSKAENVYKKVIKI